MGEILSVKKPRKVRGSKDEVCNTFSEESINKKKLTV